MADATGARGQTVSRHIRAEYEAVGLNPDDCNQCGTPYDNGAESYWFACAFHDGYIEGWMDAFIAEDVVGLRRAATGESGK